MRKQVKQIAHTSHPLSDTLVSNIDLLWIHTLTVHVRRCTRYSDIPGGCCLVLVRLSLIFSEGERSLQVSHRRRWALCTKYYSVCVLSPVYVELLNHVQYYSLNYNIHICFSVCSKIRKVWC